jgi:N-acetyl-anhydromuramyl-L-alanine amidase AmpD
MRIAKFLAIAGAMALTAMTLPAGPTHAGSRGEKRSEVREIIVHATGGPFCQRGQVVFSPAGEVDRLKKFFERSRAVSIHYIIGRNGEVARSVPEDEIAFHAIDHNDQSIGIELINAGDGREPYPPQQIEALARLIAGIQKRWRIPVSQVKGHEEVDHSTFRCGGRLVRRKQDPGPQFPWDRFKLQLMAAAKAQRANVPGPSRYR